MIVLKEMRPVFYKNMLICKLCVNALVPDVLAPTAFHMLPLTVPYTTLSSLFMLAGSKHTPKKAELQNTATDYVNTTDQW